MFTSGQILSRSEDHLRGKTEREQSKSLLTHLPVLVMTISVPILWNWSQSSLASRFTLGSSWTLSSSGGGGRGGKAPKGRRGKRPGYPYAGLKLFVGPRPENIYNQKLQRFGESIFWKGLPHPRPLENTTYLDWDSARKKQF